METPSRPQAPRWYSATKIFETPLRRKALFQVADTLGPYLGLVLLAAGLSSSGVSWVFLWPLALVAGLFLVRLFILFHDCCHGSFWPSRKANVAWGWVFGILTFTPFRSWRKSHGTHHAHNGNLDRRGVGDVWTMTLAEYLAASPARRAWYRFYRHPVFLILISPPLLFLAGHRVPDKGAGVSEVLGVHATTLGVVLWVSLLGWWAGWGFLLWFLVPTAYVATVAGVWLFYVQHQFDPGYWERSEAWDPYQAALQGSSFYRLPRWLQWFSGNIGFHHIHHLRPRIPNYRLEECFRAVPELQLPDPLTIRTSLGSLGVHLWDEAHKRWLTFRQAALLS